MRDEEEWLLEEAERLLLGQEWRGWVVPLMVQEWEDVGYRKEGWVVLLPGDFWGWEKAWLN